MTEFVNILLFVSALLFCEKTETPTITNACIVRDVDTSNAIKPSKLVWADEFNIDGAPDSTKWRYETGFIRNQEDQWYQKENAVCSNGNLVLTGKKERRANPNYIAGSTNWKTNRAFIDYTSASVVMKKEHAFNTEKWRYALK